MRQTDSLIEKGRKRLKLLLGLGLVIPIGWALFFLFVSVKGFDSRRSDWVDLPQDDDNLLFVFFLVLSIIGFFIARAIYNGREWAHALWISIGFLGGGLMFMLSLIASMVDTRTGLPFLFISALILVITLQTGLHKGVRTYLKSLRSSNDMEDKIEEIGKDLGAMG